MTADSPLLKVEEVTKQFDGVRAVDGVSFEVRRGEIFGLLGPNGAGKTTLIRMILGIFRPDAGRILYGNSVAANDGHRGLPKERVGYLPEERGLYEDRRVGETLLYLASLHGMDARRARERALSWLERLDLREHYARRLKELSKGMQQKVQFIAAVLHEPELVVLDEPFSGLDPPSQDLFLELIRGLAREGMTVLLSSHQMNLVETLCDRVFLIHKGRRVLYGDLEHIKQDHGMRVVQLRFSRCRLPEELRRRIEAACPAKVLALDAGGAELLLPKDVPPQAFLELWVNDLMGDRDLGVDVEEICITKPSLHRIFVEVVREL